MDSLPVGGGQAVGGVRSRSVIMFPVSMATRGVKGTGSALDSPFLRVGSAVVALGDDVISRVPRELRSRLVSLCCFAFVAGCDITMFPDVSWRCCVWRRRGVGRLGLRNSSNPEVSESKVDKLEQ